jgi:hypothetical protein
MLLRVYKMALGGWRMAQVQNETVTQKKGG